MVYAASGGAGGFGRCSWGGAGGGNAECCVASVNWEWSIWMGNNAIDRIYVSLFKGEVVHWSYLVLHNNRIG